MDARIWVTGGSSEELAALREWLQDEVSCAAGSALCTALSVRPSSARSLSC